jgi:Heterokaryon incompatibility protein (HET)
LNSSELFIETVKMASVPLHDDSVFYGVAAEMAEVCQAVYRSTSPAVVDAMLKYIKDVPRGQNSRAEDTAMDPILLELEHLMIREFFCSPYVYQPLDAPNAFRLLILYPGRPCEPLGGTIQYSIIDGGRSYEAISYTWGDNFKPCSILLDGRQMPLTQSLFNALVRLRYPNMDRKLWADGLCINQEDNKEKGFQVALMPKIYTYSRRVLVHLGMEADGSEHLPDLLEKLSKVELARFKAKMSPEEYLSNGLPPPDSEAWKPLVAFFRRPWFLRVWVIQEVVLARDIRFFCGDWELRWGLLSDLAERFDSVFTNNRQLNGTIGFYKAQHAAMSCGLMLALHISRSAVADRLEMLRRDIEYSPSLSSDKSHIESLTTELAAKRDFVVQSCREHKNLYSALERTIFTFDGIKPSNTPIIKLLGMFARNEATQLQDRLYALVGLAADINLEEFPPDYEETVDQTNARFGRKLVEKGQGLDLLFHATKYSIEIWNLSLPSWTPDWAPHRPMARHWLKLGWAYHQCSGGFEGRVNSTAYVSLVDDVNNVIKVTGFCVDRLESVVKLFEDISDYNLSNFAAASKRFFERCEGLMNGDLYITGESWPEVLCRTLIADRLNSRGYSCSDVLQQYEEAKLIFSNPPQERRGKSMTSWGTDWFDLMPEYSFCKTTKGYACLIPESTSATDEVFMFQGSDLPFVLRPFPTLPGYYRFVGGCYVHGLMEGEAWKLEDRRSEIFIF